MAARIGVIGTGWWATQFHLPGLVSYEHADVVALADPDTEKLAAAGERFDIASRHSDYHDLLADPRVEGVVVAVPHAFHHEIARAALDAGKHVLLEKPLTLAAADAWDLVDTAESRGLHLVAGYTFQFTRHARLVRQIVRSGRLGELYLVSGLFASMVRSYFDGSPDDYADVFDFPLTGPDPSTYSDPRISGGGQGQTQVTHAMGMVHWVTGGRPVEVFARMTDGGLPVDLADAITYRMDGGAVGTMASCGSVAPRQPQQQGIWYYGSEGLVVQDLIGGRVEAHFNDGTSELPPDLADGEVYPAEAPARCLVDLIRGVGENLAPALEAARTVEFLSAAYHAAASGVPTAVHCR